METAFCRHSISHFLESNFQGLQLCERQTEIQRGTLESKQTDFNPKNDSYKVPNKTQRMCEAVTTASSNLFLPTSGKFVIWQMHFRYVLEPADFSHISPFWKIALSKKVRFAFILSHGDSSCLSWDKKKKKPDRQRRVVCHGWLSKQGSLNEYFNWSITFLNLWLLTFLPAVSIGSSIIPN